MAHKQAEKVEVATGLLYLVSLCGFTFTFWRLACEGAWGAQVKADRWLWTCLYSILAHHVLGYVTALLFSALAYITSYAWQGEQPNEFMFANKSKRIQMVAAWPVLVVTLPVVLVFLVLGVIVRIIITIG